jgi:coenzyme PQQ biosynthesis protein PqqD
MTTLDDRPVLRRGVRLAVDPLTSGRVLLFPEGILLLNATAASVVEHCDGARTVRQILDVLATEYEGVTGSDVFALVDDLVEQRLVLCRA